MPRSKVEETVKRISDLLGRRAGSRDDRLPVSLSEQELDCKSLQDSLSGAFNCLVRVKPWLDGTIRILVPVNTLRSSGLSVVESIIDARRCVLSGTRSAVKNAEARLSKFIPSHFEVSLVGFDEEQRRAVFKVSRAG